MDPTCQYDTRIPRNHPGRRAGSRRHDRQGWSQGLNRQQGRRRESIPSDTKAPSATTNERHGEHKVATVLSVGRLGPASPLSVSVPRCLPGRNLISLVELVRVWLLVPGGHGAVPRRFKPRLGFDKLTMAVGFLHCPPKKHDSLVAAWQPWHRLPSRLVLEVDNHQVMGGMGGRGEEVRDGVSGRAGVSGLWGPFSSLFLRAS